MPSKYLPPSVSVRSASSVLAIASWAWASVWPVLTSLTLPLTAWLAFCTYWQVLLSCSQRYWPIASRSALSSTGRNWIARKLTQPLSPS